MVDKVQIQRVLARTDRIGMVAVGRALVHLYNRQTTDEQHAEQTKHHNERGFTGVDAKIGQDMALFYKRTGFLTTRQLDYWQKLNRNGTSRIGKYWRQLKEEAEAKAEAQQLPLAA
jgi:hypothetical protein